jgi:hypothetical protein
MAANVRQEPPLGLLPGPGKPFEQGRQAVRLDAVQALMAGTPSAHQAGCLQDAEMLGDRGSGDIRAGRQAAHGLLAVAYQSLEDPAPGRISDGPEDASEGVFIGLLPHFSPS